MSRVRIIPILLLRQGGLYKTTRFQKPQYVGDPINTVKIFNEKEADELILLDYSASKEKRGIDFPKIAQIAGEAFMPMAYGGGIHNLEDARQVFDCGFEKVVLNSALFSNLTLVEKIASIYGTQAVVASIDVKKNLLGKARVWTQSGTYNTGLHPLDWAKQLDSAGVGEIMLTNIGQEGTWQGYDLGLIGTIAPQLRIPLIAHGGAGGFQDFRDAVNAGASAVAAGSLFVYQKKGMGVLISFPREIINY